MKTFSILALVLLCASMGRPQDSTARPAVTLTDDEEIRIGHILAEKFATNQGIASTEETRYVDGYLQTVGSLVAAHAQRRLPYQFHFDPNPRFKSAIGLPGGQVFVGGGVLAYTDTEDQLAIVIAHEIEHIALGDCRDRVIQVLAGSQLAPGDAAKLQIEDFVSGYGHDAELAADREGVKLAMAAGYSAQAGVRLLQTFLILTQQTPGASAEAKKNLQERIAQMQAIAKAQSSPPSEIPLGLR